MIILTSYSGVWAYIKLILVFIFILFLAYYGAKFAGKYQNNVLNSKSNIKILESFRIGSNKLIAIAKIGNEFYAIGIGKDEFTLIDKLDSDYFDSVYEKKLNPDVKDLSADDGSISNKDKLNFKEILSKLSEKNNEKDK